MMYFGGQNSDIFVSILAILTILAPCSVILKAVCFFSIGFWLNA